MGSYKIIRFTFIETTKVERVAEITMFLLTEENCKRI